MIRQTLLAALISLTSTVAMAVDDYTMELFGLYCQACHTTVSSRAPQSHDVSDWKKRTEEKTLAGLVENAISGVGNMPPMGMCNECEAQDLEDIITYMSQPK